MASSSPSSSTRCWTNDVFLSFRGPDTRKGIASEIYDRLNGSGIKTIRDDQVLRVGDAISPALVKAITESRFAIVILSQNYASSSWCLEELREICLSMEENRILPLFFEVDPTDVRYQKRSFQEAFCKHESSQRHESEKVNQWRAALKKVANISGWNSDDFKTHRELVNKIVEDLCSKVPLDPIESTGNFQSYEVTKEAMGITFISDLHLNRHGDRIKVRVSRVWRPKKIQSPIYDGQHYILIDEIGDSIHAITEEDDYEHTKIMKEDCVYEIYKFHAVRHGFGYKVMDRETELRFNECTQFREKNETSCSIPRHAFQFLQFHEVQEQMQLQLQLEKQKKKERIVLRDMYGRIKQVTQENKFVQSKSQWEPICVILLENQRRETVNITLWGELTKRFDQKAVENLPPPVLAVFTGLKMVLYKGEITPTGTNHTRIIFNPEIQEAPEYQAEFSKPEDKTIFKTVKSQQWKTVADLKILDPNSYKDQTVLCRASILRFPTHSWWYKKCPAFRCYNELKKSEYGNALMCAQHGVQTHVPWYRVHMKIKDSEGVTSVKVKGKYAESFFGFTCEALLKKRQYQDEEDLPEEISNKIDESYLFRVQINGDEKIVRYAQHSSRHCH